MKIKVASWNIAGGRKIASLEHFDYQSEDLAYFAEILKSIDPDIICLQEAHTSKDVKISNATQLSGLLGKKVVVNSVNSPSHIDENSNLSNSILTNLKVNKVVEQLLPDPDKPLIWNDGRTAITHHKNLQFMSLEGFNVANNQMLPLKLFSHNYDDGDLGSRLAQGINKVMEAVVKAPIIWCGDFNYDEPLKIYSYMKELGLREALPDVTTRPSTDNVKRRPDHILYSPEFELISSNVQITETDHYLCWAEFNLYI